MKKSHDVADDEQRRINRELFELVVSISHRVNELTYQVAALRALSEAGR